MVLLMMIIDPKNFNNFRNQKTLVLLFAYPSTLHLEKIMNKGYENGYGGVKGRGRGVTTIGQS